MKQLPLSKGLFALVDDEDYPALSKFKWWANSYGYAARTIWFGRDNTPKHRHITMHRQIMEVYDPTIEIDHRNENRLDNRRCNLRACLHRQNSSNRGKTRHNTSGYKGVTKHSQNTNGWIAQIRVRGKNKYLGYFSNPRAAAAAYDKAAAKAFGEFAKLNDIPKL